MIYQALATFILPLGGIIFIDLVLSGDNALVIGSAIVGIPRRWRKLALLLGGATAILLRILCTVSATFLLRIDYLQTIGGLLLLWVTWRLLVEPKQTEESEIFPTHSIDQQNKTRGTFFPPVVHLFSRLQHLIISARQPKQQRFLLSVLTIVVTDISMSLDNIVAIAALARRQLIILSIGLIISIIILLGSSTLVALLLERYPGLITLSGFVLALIAGNLIVQDMSNLLPFFRQHVLYSSIPVYLLTLFFVVSAIRVRRRRARRPPSSPPEDADPSDAQIHKQSDPVSPDIPLQKELQFASGPHNVGRI